MSLLLLFFLIVPATGYSSVRWANVYGDSTGSDEAYDVCLTSDGGYVVAGHGWRPEHPNYGLWLFRLDALGKLLWNRVYFGVDHVYAGANSVTPTRNGGFAAAGCCCTDTSATDTRGYVLLVDSLGDSLRAWSFGSELCQANDIEQTQDGGYVIAGETFHPRGWGSGFLVARFDSIGDSLWSICFGHDSVANDARAVKQTPDGGFIVAGDTDISGIGGNCLVRLDASGHLVWRRIVATGGNGLTGVTPLADGGFMVAGILGGKGYLARTDSSGRVRWSRCYGGNSNQDFFNAMDTSGRDIILAGSTASYGSGWYDAWIVRTDSNGVQLWSQTFGGRGWDDAYGTHATPDGGAIAAGYSGSFSPFNDAYVIKVDADGSAGIVGEPGRARDVTDHAGVLVSPTVLSAGQSLHCVLPHSRGVASATLHDISGPCLGRANWNMANSLSHDVPIPAATASGTYFVVVSATGLRAVQRVLIMR